MIQRVAQTPGPRSRRPCRRHRRRARAERPQPEASGSTSGSTSGSIDVQLSDASCPRQASSRPPRRQVARARVDRRPGLGREAACRRGPGGSAIPVVAVARDESRPIASGKAAAVAAGELTEPRSKRIADAAKDALGAGVSKLGSGIGSARRGCLQARRPVAQGAGRRLGVAQDRRGHHATSASSCTCCPQVARTRRGRLLIRSMIVGFVLVAAWIVVIVALQLHGNDTPDFRPDAERILVELSKGGDRRGLRAGVAAVPGDGAQGAVHRRHDRPDPRRSASSARSPRSTTRWSPPVRPAGSAASRSPSRTTRRPARSRSACTTIRAAGSCSASASSCRRSSRSRRPSARSGSRRARTRWTSSTAMSTRPPTRSSSSSSDGHADQVWDDASQVFQKQEQKAKFVQLQHEHLAALGNYRRIIAVSEAKVIGGTSATFDTLAEFDKASGVRTVFGFCPPLASSSHGSCAASRSCCRCRAARRARMRRSRPGRLHRRRRRRTCPHVTPARSDGWPVTAPRFPRRGRPEAHPR